MKEVSVPIVMIGGIPGVGKTSISGSVARETGINITLSGDYIREAIRPFVPSESILNTSVYEAWRFFGEENERNILNGFLEQGKIVNRATSGVVKRAIGNGEPIIIETLYFIPDQFKDLLESMITLYIHIPDRSVHVNRLNERQNYTHFGSPGQRLSENLYRYDIMKNESLRQCDIYGIKKFENRDYTDTRQSIVDFVKRSIDSSW